MDPSESSKNNKEDKSSSPQLSYLAGPVSPDFDLSFLDTFDHGDSFLLDEIDCERVLLDSSPPKQLFENESDINIGGELPSDEDPHNTEEPTTAPQELLEYFDGDIEFDFVDWTTPERSEANEFADLVFDPQHCHDSHGQAIKKRRLKYEEAASNADIGSDNSSFPTHFQEVPVSGSNVPPLDDTNISTPVLHLNCLIDALPPVHSATTDKGLMESTKRKSTRLRLVFSPDRYGRSTVHITRHEPSLHFITTESHETHNPSVAPDMVTSDSESPSMTQPLTSSLSPANVDHDDKSTISTTNDRDTDDSRKCTCKRSACTKLYCDCFAAELYCAECCTCQGCINRAEYKDFLLDIKKNMMSRDPFAFAPKIVQDATNTLSNNTENDNLKTPSSSARHRKGCHCTKSKCLKNYCECFEIKVGCTVACQCLGCENSYGRKEGHVANEGAMSKEKDGDGVEKSSDSLHAELGDNDVHGFSPLTPSLHLQRSNMGKSSDASPVTPQGSSARLMNPLMTGLEETTTNLEHLELSPSASGGLKRPGRKFVWKSVSSFPPLTPSLHSKANGNDGGDGAKEPEKQS